MRISPATQLLCKGIVATASKSMSKESSKNAAFTEFTNHVHALDALMLDSASPITNRSQKPKPPPIVNNYHSSGNGSRPLCGRNTIVPPSRDGFNFAILRSRSAWSRQMMTPLLPGFATGLPACCSASSFSSLVFKLITRLLQQPVRAKNVNNSR